MGGTTAGGYSGNVGMPNQASVGGPGNQGWQNQPMQQQSSMGGMGGSKGGMGNGDGQQSWGGDYSKSTPLPPPTQVTPQAGPPPLSIAQQRGGVSIFDDMMV